MPSPTPPLRELASWLLAEEIHEPQKASTSDGSYVCDQLGISLKKLAGTAGFQNLLARALLLARQEVSWLADVHVTEDGSLSGFKIAKASVIDQEAINGETVLIAQLIGLLFLFIGTSLTMQLLRQTWPHATIRTEDPSDGRTP